MSYDLCVLAGALQPVDTAGKSYINSVGSTGVGGEIVTMKRVEVRRIYYAVKIASLTGTANAVITFRIRPIFGSTSGQSTIGTLTIPTGAAIGQVIYKDVTPVAVNAGSTVAFDLTTAGTDSGSATGTGMCGIDAYLLPEDRLNETKMVASA